MHVTICFRSGVHIEGRVLFFGSRFLRVAIPGKAHSADFWFRNGEWSTESGDPVEVDLSVASGMGDVTAWARGSPTRTKDPVLVA